MDEIKRYDIGTEQTGHGIYGIRIDEENDGDWCKYEDVMEKFKKAKLKPDNSEYAKCVMLNEKIIQQFIKQAFLDGCEYGNSASVNDDEAAERYATETISAVKDYLTTKKEV